MQAQIALILEHPALIAIIFVWSIIWKGLALWRAGTRRDKWWFVVLLIVNTLGVLEILYLLIWGNRKSLDKGTRNDSPHDGMFQK